jgi:chromosome segregation ATPase
MMMLRLSTLLAVMAWAESSFSQSRDSPIRRIVTMLQTMQTKVIEEGKKDAIIHDRYMCFCRSNNLEDAVATAEKKLPALQSSIKEYKAMTEQLTSELEEHKKVRADAETTIKEANAIRNKDAFVFSKESADKKNDLTAMGKAITAIEKGMNYEFLQTDAAATVQRLIQEVNMGTNEREVLLSFFSQKHADPVSDSYSPASGQIVGLLRQMKADMEKELTDMTAQEQQAVADFQSLMSAKNKELAAATMAIQDKQSRFADAAVQLQTMKEDYADTSATLEQDKLFLADKDANCAKAETDYANIKKTRAEELLALSETIKILNDDDALELFKKTLPSPSLLQVTAASRQTVSRALKALHSTTHNDPRIDFIMLALHGKKVSFDKVIKMIDDMVKLLDKEQYDDDLRQEICVEDLDRTEDKLKTTEGSIKNIEKVIEEDKDLAQTTGDEINNLQKGIKELDKSVTDATGMRKEDHEEYTATLAENKAAKDLLLLAKNRLSKFYHPALYKAPPKEELSADAQIAQNMGMTFVQVSVHSFVQAPPPEAVGAYKVKKK